MAGVYEKNNDWDNLSDEDWNKKLDEKSQNLTTDEAR